MFKLIIINSLVSSNKIAKNFCFKVRLLTMISTKRNKLISWPLFMNNVFGLAFAITLKNTVTAHVNFFRYGLKVEINFSFYRV